MVEGEKDVIVEKKEDFMVEEKKNVLVEEEENTLVEEDENAMCQKAETLMLNRLKACCGEGKFLHPTPSQYEVNTTDTPASNLSMDYSVWYQG